MWQAKMSAGCGSKKRPTKKVYYCITLASLRNYFKAKIERLLWIIKKQHSILILA
ncbi:MAG: hypothetical protein ACI9WS_001303, partial [Paraglaciecola psychrophila]